jgi:hypothetical protein
MKKLKLESLEVTSFETSAAAVRRGTVVANAPPQGTLPVYTYDVDVCGESYYVEDCGETYNVYLCPETKHVDCTKGCSVNVTCGQWCILTG